MTTTPGAATPEPADGGLLVGVDVGASSVTAAAFTPDGAPAGTGRAALPWASGPAGPELPLPALDAAVRDALEQLLRTAPPGPVLGVGVTTGLGSGVLLDRRGRAAAAVVAGDDAHDLAEVEELRAHVGGEGFALVTGLPLRRGWPVTVHRHLTRTAPGARRAAGAVRRRGVAEHVVASLGGAEVSDLSLASRTGWLDLHARDWWAAGLALSGVDPALLPPLVPSGSDCGRVGEPVTAGGSGEAGRAGAAGGEDAGAPPALARLRGAVLTTAGHGDQAAALGADAARPGAVLDLGGAAEVLVRTAAPGLPPEALLRLTRAGATVGWHAVPGAWCVAGGTGGGAVLQRALEELGVESERPEHLVALDAAGELRWLAAVETAVDEVGALLALVDAAAGRHTELVVTGGWAGSVDVLLARQRRFGALVVRDGPGSEEPAARGAALLAGRAAGVLAPTGGWAAGGSVRGPAGAGSG